MGSTLEKRYKNLSQDLEREKMMIESPDRKGCLELFRSDERKPIVLSRLGVNRSFSILFLQYSIKQYINEFLSS